MNLKTATDIVGLEFDWLAADAAGNVAFFSTAGGGYAPDGFLSDTDASDKAIDAILDLPSRTTADCSIQVRSELTNIWELMAERGVFAFDSTASGGPYRRVATPKVPVCLNELPTMVVDIVRRVMFPSIKFCDLESVDVESLQQRK